MPPFRAAIFGEPTDGKLACGHRGLARVSVSAAYDYPGLGPGSATAALVRALGRLLDAQLGASRRFGNTTVEVESLGSGVVDDGATQFATAEVAVTVAVGDRESGADMVVDGIRRVVVDRAQGEEKGGLSVKMERGFGPIVCECDVKGGFSGRLTTYQAPLGFTSTGTFLVCDVADQGEINML